MGRQMLPWLSASNANYLIAPRSMTGEGTHPPTPLAPIRDFLTSHLGPITGLRPLGAGAWSRAYAFRCGDADLVVRFGALIEDFCKDRLAAQWASPVLPIPRIIELGECDIADAGRFFAISERARGSFLEEMSPARVGRALPSLFETLDALREVEVAREAGFGLWDAEGRGSSASWREALLSVADDPPGRRIHGWRRRLAADPQLEDLYEQGVAALAALVPACPEIQHVVHSDLPNRNVLVAQDRITAVLDWGSALYGDPLYDIAWLIFWAPWHPGLAAHDIRAAAYTHLAARGFDLAAFDERLRCYQLHIGLDSQSYNCYIGDLETALIVARQTLAVVDP